MRQNSYLYNVEQRPGGLTVTFSDVLNLMISHSEAKELSRLLLENAHCETINKVTGLKCEHNTSHENGFFATHKATSSSVMGKNGFVTQHVIHWKDGE